MAEPMELSEPRSPGIFIPGKTEFAKHNVEVQELYDKFLDKEYPKHERPERVEQVPAEFAQYAKSGDLTTRPNVILSKKYKEEHSKKFPSYAKASEHLRTHPGGKINTRTNLRTKERFYVYVDAAYLELSKAIRPASSRKMEINNKKYVKSGALVSTSNVSGTIPYGYKLQAVQVGPKTDGVKTTGLEKSILTFERISQKYEPYPKAAYDYMKVMEKKLVFVGIGTFLVSNGGLSKKKNIVIYKQNEKYGYLKPNSKRIPKSKNEVEYRKTLLPANLTHLFFELSDPEAIGAIAIYNNTKDVLSNRTISMSDTMRNRIVTMGLLQPSEQVGWISVEKIHTPGDFPQAARNRLVFKALYWRNGYYYMNVSYGKIYKKRENKAVMANGNPTTSTTTKYKFSKDRMALVVNDVQGTRITIEGGKFVESDVSLKNAEPAARFIASAQVKTGKKLSPAKFIGRIPSQSQSGIQLAPIRINDDIMFNGKVIELPEMPVEVMQVDPKFISTTHKLSLFVYALNNTAILMKEIHKAYPLATTEVPLSIPPGDYNKTGGETSVMFGKRVSDIYSKSPLGIITGTMNVYESRGIHSTKSDKVYGDTALVLKEMQKEMQ
jgi:hypothetical protein